MARTSNFPTNLSSYTQKQLQTLWVLAGGPPDQAVTASAVAMAESTGRGPGEIDHDKNGSTDYGLWQINSIHGYNSAELLSNALYNAKAAVAVYNGSGWGAWTTYTSGAYLQYLNTDDGTTGSVVSGVKSGIAVIRRPGGTGASSSTTYAPTPGTTPNPVADQAALSDSPVAPTDVSFGGDLLAPFKFALDQSWTQWKDFENGIKGPVDAVVDAAHALGKIEQEFYRIIVNLRFYTMRFVEFTTGMTLMGLGLWLMMSGSGGTQTGPARALRTVIQATPIGRETRALGATRAGRREGHAEHYRLKARQEERSRLSASDARKQQQQGQARRG